MKGVAVLVREPLEVVAVPLEQVGRRPLAHPRELGRLLGERDLKCENARVGQRRGVPDTDRAAEVTVLVEQRDPEPGVPRDRPAHRRHRAGDDLEQRRLAAAVSPDHPPAVTLGHRKRHIAEERSGAEFHGDVGKREEGHPGKIAVGEGHLECPICVLPAPGPLFPV